MASKTPDYEFLIKDYLTKRAGSRRTREDLSTTAPEYVYHYSGEEDFVLQHGVFHQPARLEGYRPREMGQCYQNAFTLLKENPDDLLYCEGYASRGWAPIFHCYNLHKETGRVVDVTWPWGDENEEGNPKGYFGVQFPTKLVLAFIETAPHYGLLDDEANFWPLLRTRYRPEELLRRLPEIKRQRKISRTVHGKLWGQ